MSTHSRVVAREVEHGFGYEIAKALDDVRQHERTLRSKALWAIPADHELEMAESHADVLARKAADLRSLAIYLRNEIRRERARQKREMMRALRKP